MTYETFSYTVHDVLHAGHNLEPLSCLHCGVVGETTFNQGIGDAHCAACGAWQLEKKQKTNEELLCV